MRWEFLHLWLLSYVSYPRILHISEQFNWLKFLVYTQGMSGFEFQFRYQAKEVQFRQQYIVQVGITLNERSYVLSRRLGWRGPHPEYCEYIGSVAQWLAQRTVNPWVVSLNLTFPAIAEQRSGHLATFIRWKSWVQIPLPLPCEK